MKKTCFINTNVVLFFPENGFFLPLNTFTSKLKGGIIENPILSNSWLVFFVLMVALFLACLVTFFIARRIGKSMAEKYKRWIYLLVSLLPLKELLQIVAKQGVRPQDPFLWFWFLFWSYCVFMFWWLRSRYFSHHKEVL